ncbi:MAG: DUF4339 domain-containing protein [Chthoniobacteraceae bacterium]
MNNLYYTKSNDTEAGPYTLAQLQNMWKSGSITGNVFYRQGDGVQWQPLFEIATTLEASPTAEKSRGTYIVLGILLGGLGIHNFYLGRYLEAVPQLLWWILVTLIMGYCIVEEGMLLPYGVLGIMVLTAPWVALDIIIVMCGGFKKRLE